MENDPKKKHYLNVQYIDYAFEYILMGGKSLHDTVVILLL